MKLLYVLPCVFVALYSCAPVPVPAAFSLPVSSSDRSLATTIYQQVNAYRQTKGKKPLARHSGLDQLARQHSEDMMRNRGDKAPKGIVNHAGFGNRFSLVQQKYNIDSLHENAAVAPRGFSVVDTWIKSRGHESAMRTNWSCTGVGAVVDTDGTVFATQLFGNFTIPRTRLQSRGPAF